MRCRPRSMSGISRSEPAMSAIAYSERCSFSACSRRATLSLHAPQVEGFAQARDRGRAQVDDGAAGNAAPRPRLRRRRRARAGWLSSFIARADAGDGVDGVGDERLASAHAAGRPRCRAASAWTTGRRRHASSSAGVGLEPGPATTALWRPSGRTQGQPLAGGDRQRSPDCAACSVPASDRRGNSRPWNLDPREAGQRRSRPGPANPCARHFVACNPRLGG